MSSKILPMLSNNDVVCDFRRQSYLKKVRSNYSSSTRANRENNKNVKRYEYNKQNRRSTDDVCAGGKKTRQGHIGSKFLSRLRVQEKKRNRRVAACDEWNYVSEG